MATPTIPDYNHFLHDLKAPFVDYDSKTHYILES